MSTRFLSDDKIEALGEEHGAAGPLTVVALLQLARIQSDGGKVDGTWRELAHEAYTDRKTAEAVVTEAIKLGLLSGSTDSRGFKVQFPAWRRWQEAFRKARAREQAKSATRPHVSATRPQESSTNKTNKTKNGGTKKPKNGKPDRESSPLSFLLADMIEGNGSKRPTVTKGWADEERRMVNIDARDPEEAARLIRWAQSDQFWRSNIMSMGKFRVQYDRLRLQAKAAEQRGDVPTSTPNPFIDT